MIFILLISSLLPILTGTNLHTIRLMTIASSHAAIPAICTVTFPMMLGFNFISIKWWMLPWFHSTLCGIFDWHTTWLRWTFFKAMVHVTPQDLCSYATELQIWWTNWQTHHVSKSFNPECFAVTIGNVRHPLRQILDLRWRAFQRDHLKRLWMNCLGRYLVSKMQRVRACGILWQRRVPRCWHAVISNKAIVA